MLMKESEYKIMYYCEDKSWWYVGLRNLLIYYIKKYSKKNLKILDAGCGTGKNIEVLKANNYDIYGIDISDDVINFCRKRGIVDNIQLGSIANIPYNSNYFDVLYSFDVLHNLDEDLRGKAVREFFRVVKPDGIIIINCAAFEWLRSQHDDIVGNKKRFSKGELEGLFKDFDTEIIKSSYRVFLLFPPIALVKIIKKLIKLLNKKSITDNSLPPTIINWILTKIQLLECGLIKNFNLPFGTSVFLVLKKL